jgi:hypothetical protein
MRFKNGDRLFIGYLPERFIILTYSPEILRGLQTNHIIYIRMTLEISDG